MQTFWRLLERPRILLLTALVFGLLHAAHVSEAPNGYHRWRETDTAMVAENFHRGSMDFLHPQVNVLGNTNGIVGMELPLYNYTSAVLYRVAGFAHLWPRLLSMAATMLLVACGWRVVLHLTHDVRLAGLYAWMLAASPLVFFYGGKIQPDVLGLALTMGGFLVFISAVRANRVKRLITAALLLAAGAGIKPTFLFVGLPMLVVLFSDEGKVWLRRPRYWLFAAAVVLPVTLWLTHARALTEAYGDSYFYLGQDLRAALASLAKPRFYEQVLVSWPLELGVGLLLAPYLVAGCGGARQSPAGRVMLSWLLGCLVVFGLAAEHCSTPHDYYYLPAVPALMYFAAVGARKALAAHQWLQVVTVVALAIAPIFAFGRMQQRYASGGDFAGVRSAVAAYVADQTTGALSLDTTPGYLLYRTGLKGARLSVDATQSQLRQAQRSGYRYLIHAAAHGRLAPELAGSVAGAPLIQGGIVVVPLRSAPEGLAPDSAAPILNKP